MSTAFDLSKILRPVTIAKPHAQDLEKSKISIEAAMAAGIATVPPDMISKVLGVCNFGWALDRVNSLLAFQYPLLNGGGDPGYFRVRVYPPIETKEGTAKYLQPKGSTNHLYLPPGVDPKGKEPIYITEGEKKAYCLTLHGFPCIGLGGVYGWKRDGKAISDLDAITWKKRDVIIVYDADIAVNEAVAQAEAKLAEELIFRKARVFTKRLPYGPDCAKGADDFITVHGVESFKKLKIKFVKPKKLGRTSKTTGVNTDSSQPVSLIDELNKKHAVVMISGKCAIMNEVTDPISNRPDVTFSSIYDFKNYYSNKKVEYINDEGKKCEVALSKLWLDSARRRQYEGIAFAPGRDIPGYYNLFRGFAVAPAHGDWSLFREHIFHNICRGNVELFNYVMQWMARNVQDPGGDRPGVAIVLKSPERGTGKGIFATQYGKTFGNHFKHITQTTQVVGRFNSHLKDCLLLFVDEGVWGGDRPAEGVLKGLITEPQIMIEPKGINAFPVENHVSFIIASNNEWIIPAGFEERRFLVLDVSPVHKQDTEYFGAIVDQMDQGGRAAMLYDLLEMKITLDLRKVPRTQALLDQVVHGMTTVQKVLV